MLESLSLVSEFTGNIIRPKMLRILAKMMFSPVTTSYEIKQEFVKKGNVVAVSKFSKKEVWPVRLPG